MFNRFEKPLKRRIFAKCRYSRDSLKVQSHLTLTPAQIYGMSMQGKPISTFMLSADNFDDGIPAEATDIQVPLHERRGIDINDIYQHTKEFETKMREFRMKRNQRRQTKTE